jgi:predicted transcriptional regulator
MCIFENPNLKKLGGYKVCEYFEHITRRLTIEELEILGRLLEEDATATFKAIKRKDVFEVSGWTLANFRKIMTKLTATALVSMVMGGKEQKVYLTNYGQEALEKSLEEV